MDYQSEPTIETDSAKLHGLCALRRSAVDFTIRGVLGETQDESDKKNADSRKVRGEFHGTLSGERVDSDVLEKDDAEIDVSIRAPKERGTEDERDTTKEPGKGKGKTDETRAEKKGGSRGGEDSGEHGWVQTDDDDVIGGD